MSNKHPFVDIALTLDCEQCKAKGGDLCVDSNGVHLSSVKDAAKFAKKNLL